MSTPTFDAQTGRPSPYTGGPHDPLQPRPASERKGLAITALVLGIVALLGCWIPFLNIGSALLGLVGVVLGIIAIVQASRGNAGGRGMALTGTILSAVAVVLAVAISIATYAFVSTTVQDRSEVITQSLDEAGVDEDTIEAPTPGEGANTDDTDGETPGATAVDVELFLQQRISEVKLLRESGDLWEQIPDDEFNRTAVSAYLYLMTDMELATRFGVDEQTADEYVERARHLEELLMAQEPLGSSIDLTFEDGVFRYDGDTGEGGYVEEQ
ncbi:hypothetical protein GCM10009718_22180 [Isoptericola halotolerans]|uniref:DUF4190 domain-containing protein n=1 Tax=Isoptericola halotolerans TaxID=300560 RepID=A0ABX2AAD2_9MICO|nr:DUF4190 domain-containing protein [Isoptericola halotolerans]NOV98848.1 hypothetical protein [Isoptericola halotolerans]